LFRTIHLNCRSSKHCKKAKKISIYIFTALYLLVGTDLNLDPDSNPDPELITDPDPNLKIISDTAGSGCATLPVTVYFSDIIRLTFLSSRLPFSLSLLTPYN
jgi:hypothetical protein